MSTGADAKTMPSTSEFCDGHERIYGKDKRPERGRWIQDPKTGKLVPAHEYVPEARYSVGDGIASGRFYENTMIPVCENGQVKQIDVGSRQRHRTFLKDRGLTTADDYDKPGGEWERAAKERADRQQGKFPAAEDREHRETIGRIWYEVDQKRRNAKRR